MSLYLNCMTNYNLAWNFISLTSLALMRSNWRGKSTTCTWCHWINLIWTMRPSRYFKYLLPQFSTLLLLFIIQLCHITNGLMSPEDVSRNNFDKNIVNTWLTCFSNNELKTFLKNHCCVYSRVRNKHTPMLIDFFIFFPRATLLLKIKRFVSYYISLHILVGLRFFFISIFPGATSIQGSTSIPDSRVTVY